MAEAGKPSGLRARMTSWGARASESRSVRLTANWLRGTWGALLVIVLSLALGIGALINPGVEKTDLRLNEGSVYVQNQSRALLGSLNYQIDAIAAATSVGDQQSSIMQEGNFVLVNNAGSSTLQIYDPATNSLSSPVTPPTGALFSMNAGKLAVTNPENGRVWYGDAPELARSDFQSAATMNTENFGKAIVTAQGNLIGLNVQESKLMRPDGSEVQIPFDMDSTSRSAELSAVGEKAVVLDRTSQQLWIEDSRQPITVSGGSNAKLAPPTASADAGGKRAQVIYATQAGLIAVVDGRPTSLTGQMDATPITPAVVGECVYGVFGQTFTKVCKGGDAEKAEVPEVPTGAQLEFLVNRDSVVLQDVVSGKAWLVDKGMKIVNNWADVDPEDKTQNHDPNPPDDRVTLPDRTKPNRPPVAQDDPNLGARVGRSTTLPILDNDSDEDGDLLTLVAAPKVEGANLQVTGNGAGLQITLPQDANGVYRFTYEITDGRGGFASATATVTALPADPKASNQRPVNIRQGDALIMNSGTTASKRVLVNWRDPDGDDLVLVNAMPESPESEDEVTFTADGTVTFRDVGKTTGPKRVRVWISDGTVEVEGFLNVDVRKRGSAPPIANGDFVTTMVGREIVVRPLLNDEGNNLALTEVDPSTSVYTIVANYAENEFRFRSNTAGIYYVQYKVSNGPVSVGLVRIDVQPTSDQNNAPVAVRDVALVPFGGSVIIDPLLNDTDADNDVLVVQSVTQHPALRIVMRDRHLLTISSVHHTDEPIALTYWVSDGKHSTPGTILVYPAPPTGSHAPRAVNDSIKARAGTVISVPVLRNDSSPVGLDLKLVRLPDNQPNAWIDGELVRMQIPETEQAGLRQIAYEIEDANGRRASALVNVTVVSLDAQNEAPLPPLVEARVLSGSETKIPIPLRGVDPNGDTVRLLGLGSGPRLGRVTEVAEGWIRYQAYGDSRGTDSFRYQIIDSFGVVGSGEIRVGVAPRTENNQGPIAMPDEVTVRPGRAVTIPVLTNDYDVDGDSFTFAPERPPEMPFETEIVNDQFLAMRAPNEEGDFVGKYYVQDVRGAQGNGSVYLHVQKDAPLLTPIANDDQLLVNDILGKEWVSADVLANDYDIDGSRDQLTITVPDMPTSQVVVQDRKISVKVQNEMQQIRYQITDADGNVAFAVLLVPGLNDSIPVLVDPGQVHEVVSGDVFTINLATMVKGTAGRATRLTTSEAVSATKGQLSLRPDAIDFRAELDYAGPGAVVFEVTDAAGPDDPTGKRAFLTVLIDIKPAPEGHPGYRDTRTEQRSNLAPTGPSQIELTVGAGEPAELFNIRPQFSDPEGDNFNFDTWQIDATDGITVSVGVGNDTFSARGGVANKGAIATLRGRVFDVVGASRNVTVVIRVVGSTRPLPVAQPDMVPDAAAGRTSTVPVLMNDRSYLVDNQQLKLISASVVSGSGAASVDGDQVKVTPSADMVGPMVVRYTIVDATLDGDRYVDGQIQLEVRSRPSRPGTPVAQEVGNRFAVINWTSGNPNGAPVTSRRVEGVSSGGHRVVKTDCETSTCRIDGLVNAVYWKFTVTETNELGTSDPSPASADAFPDVKPDKIIFVETKFDGTPEALVVSWTPPHNEGSPITEYLITPDNPEVKPFTVGKDVTRTEVKGLENGKPYSFRVQAKNQTNEWSDISESSNQDHPSGPPNPPTGVGAKDSTDEIGHKLEVEWTEPAGLYDPIIRYDLIAVPEGGGDEISQPHPGPETKKSMDNIPNRVPFRVYVVAVTRGGSSVRSQPSEVTLATGRPEVPATGKVVASGPEQVTVSIDKPANGEYDQAVVEIFENGQLVGRGEWVPAGTSKEFKVNPGKEIVARARPFSQATPGVEKYADMQYVTEIGKVKSYGRPSFNVSIPSIADNVSWEFEISDVNVPGSDKKPTINGTNGSIPLKDADGKGRIVLPSDGKSRTYSFTVCDGDASHKNNCTTIERSYDAPLVGTWSNRSQGEVKITNTTNQKFTIVCTSPGNADVTLNTAETGVLKFGSEAAESDPSTMTCKVHPGILKSGRTLHTHNNIPIR